MLDKFMNVAVVALTAGLLSVPSTAQAQPAALTGITDTEIHIGQWGPQTGPAAPWGSVARGTGMLFKMVNDAGGIHGRKIVYHMFDDQYNPAKTVAGVKELVEKAPGVFGFASGVGRRDAMDNTLMLARLFQMLLVRAGDKEIDTAQRLIEESRASSFLRRTH